MEAFLDFKMPHLLRNEVEYRTAVGEIDQLLGRNPKRGTEECDRLEFLALLVSDYESRKLDMGKDLTTPQDVVDFMIEQKGFTRGDLAEWLGGRSRVSDFFAGKRTLSKSQILVLRERLGIPADLLIVQCVTSLEHLTPSPRGRAPASSPRGRQSFFDCACRRNDPYHSLRGQYFDGAGRIGSVGRGEDLRVIPLG